jgi:cysteine desulfurase
MIYLDNAASTPMFADLVDDHIHSIRHHFGNPSSTHKMGYELREIVKAASEAILDTAGADTDTAFVIFTSGATESNNLAINGLRNRKPAHLAASIIAHPSVMEPCHTLAAEGAALSLLKVDGDGRILGEQLSRCENPLQFLSVCYIHNETGVIQDLESIRRKLDSHHPDAVLHVDGVQAFGKYEIPWTSAGIDLLSISGHKCHGPASSGALICRKGISLSPLIRGGGQQNGWRSGSVDAIAIHALGRAAETCRQQREMLFKRAEGLNHRCRELLTGMRRGDGSSYGAICHVEADRTSPYILSVAIPGFEAAVLSRMLGEQDIMVGTGSACSAQSKEPSKTLSAMGIPRELAFATLRFSFGEQNTDTEVHAAISSLNRILNSY